MTQTAIIWSQAKQLSAETIEANKIKFNHTLQEIKESDFSMLDYLDVAYYAQILTQCDPDQDTWEANDVRRLNMANTKANSFDIINTFENDDSDEIIDFY